MEIGQKVVVTTTSGSRAVNHHGAIIGGGGAFRESATIVAMNCVLPTFNAEYYGRNDIIIQVCKTKKLVFTQERFLKLVEPVHTISFDGGEPVTISDQSYQAMKQSLTQ